MINSSDKNNLTNLNSMIYIEKKDFTFILSRELNIPYSSIEKVIQLLNDGNTIPFIARYRKEMTGNLDEVQIRLIQEKLTYLIELEERRQTILESINSQGKLTEELRNQILGCSTKHGLEDLYLPYKPKRRTRAMIAREKGLEPLAILILEQPKEINLEEEIKKYLSEEKGLNEIEDVLAGARDIVAEIISENAEIRKFVRDTFFQSGILISKVEAEHQNLSSKFEQYYDFKEKLQTIPSHRYLAIRRGEKEGILKCTIEIEQEPIFDHVKTFLKNNPRSPLSTQLILSIEDSYRRLIAPSVETDIRMDLKMQSDRTAVNVFAENLRHLLLAAPLGHHAVLGIDPGLRTGCKCAAIDNTGKFIENITFYITEKKDLEHSRQLLLNFINKHRPIAIAIGNGTGGKETESFVRESLKNSQNSDIIVIQVNEAGASVYSASDIAREEFPDIDLTIRGAISIARRLQDPLAELVKVDPKSIGVGQYQHDVYQPLLHDKLGEVVESCVNQVGVELNTASAPLLSYVAGIGSSLSKNIVKYREQYGLFTSREQLFKVPGLGKKTFEQAAGFLRIRGGYNPLDASAVHPERYELIERIAKDLNISLSDLITNATLVDKIDLKQYISETVGELTLKDILDELKKPGRDPRAAFEKPCFRDDINSIQDLKPGMILEGIVTNVTAFGAFIDLGVHQDGLIHISELSDKYITNPNEVVSVGDKLKVKVLNVDVERKRISLTTKINSEEIHGASPVGLIKKSQSSQHFKNDPKKNYDVKQPISKGNKQKTFQSNPFANLK